MNDKERAFIVISINNYDKQEELNPDKFDISELKEFIDNIEKLVKPQNCNDIVSFNIEKGSVKCIIKSPKYIVEDTNKFLKENIDYLKDNDERRIRPIEFLQENSKVKNRIIDIYTSIDKEFHFKITPITNYKLNNGIFVDTELSLYGIVTYLGGKTNPSIHLDTKEYGIVVIRTEDYILKDIKYNLLYKEIGINVEAKQNTVSYKLENVKFKSFIKYKNNYDKEYISKLIEKSSEKWTNTNISEYIEEVRGYK